MNVFAVSCLLAKKIDLRDFLRTVARDSWEKEHSNCQGEDFSESGQSKDVNKSHPEYPLFRELH